MNERMKQHYKDRLYEIAHREYEKEQIVLLGDCVIENIDIDRYFDGHTVYNNGINGDTATKLKETLYKRAIKYKPSKLFISIGSNDFGFDGATVKEVYNNIIDIVKEVQRRSKNTEIYLVTVVSVNPANADYINREYVDTRDNSEITMLNYYLKNYANRNRMKFVDINKHLKNDFDQLNLEYSIDGFHLNDTGYKLVTDLIKQYV